MAPPMLGPMVMLIVSVAGCGALGALSLQSENGAGAVAVPRGLSAGSAPRRRVASGLDNPRGILVRSDGSLLVAVAGTGQPHDARSGGLLRLIDVNADGDFDDSGERTTLLGQQPSRNILDIVQRDEVFGMAAIAQGGGLTLASHALFSGPSVVFEIDGDRVSPWAVVHGNLNHLTYDADRQQWFAVSSSSDELVRLRAGGRGERVLKFAPLAQGQDAVPGYLRTDPVGGGLLVSVFSGSPLGESGGDGTELVAGAGAILRVDPGSKQVSAVVTGLTAPTDFLVDEHGRLYVLELCDAFVDGVSDRAQLVSTVHHGGFRRFSGRLLRIDPRARAVEVVASALDTPTNLARAGQRIFIAQGMGTPGRAIPIGEAVVELDGFIEVVELAD